MTELVIEDIWPHYYCNHFLCCFSIQS